MPLKSGRENFQSFKKSCLISIAFDFPDKKSILIFLINIPVIFLNIHGYPLVLEIESLIHLFFGGLNEVNFYVDDNGITLLLVSCGKSTQVLFNQFSEPVFLGALGSDS